MFSFSEYCHQMRGGKIASKVFGSQNMQKQEKNRSFIAKYDPTK